MWGEQIGVDLPISMFTTKLSSYIHWQRTIFLMAASETVNHLCWDKQSSIWWWTVDFWMTCQIFGWHAKFRKSRPYNQGEWWDVKVQFKMNELPNDMKMLCFLLSNSATYFTTILFANVNRNDAMDIKKFFGTNSLIVYGWTRIVHLNRWRKFTFHGGLCLIWFVSHFNTKYSDMSW